MNPAQKVRRLLIMTLGLLVLFGLVFAQSYRVDVTGGSPLLEEEVVAAFKSWAEATEGDIDAELADDATTVFKYGDASRFGPDTLSLTLSRTEGEDALRDLLILVNPSAAAERSQVLLHETGRVLGLPLTQEGIMNPALQADTPAAITPEDAEALQARRTSVPEDINRDGIVDFYDLVQLAREFGRTGVGLAADIDNDGTVDEQDLTLLRATYTFAAPSETPYAPETRAPTPESEESTGELPELPEPAAPDEDMTVEEPVEEGLPDEEPEDTESIENEQSEEEVDDSPPDDEEE